MSDYGYKHNALKEAQAYLERQIEYYRAVPIPPWRIGGPDTELDQMKEALSDITQQIIDIEIEARDPEQYSERYAEIAAEMHLTGVSDDPGLYLHTPEQERQYQKDIQRQIEYGYYDDDGYWNDGLYGDYYDTDCINVCGWQVEADFADEALAFATFLSFITGVALSENEWGDEFYFEDDIAA